MKPALLNIDGMTCASCVLRVERALQAVPGVQSATVNLATEQALVSCDDGTLPEALVAAVTRAGYEGALVQTDTASPPATRRRHDEGWKVAVAAALTAPLVLPMLAALFDTHVMLPGALQLALASPVQFWLGARFYRAGWAALRAGEGNMDLLVALGSSAAWALSVVLWWTDTSGHPHLYFESGASVVTLVLFGKWLEARAKRQTLAALEALRQLRPDQARVRRDGVERTIALERVRVGDEVVVLPGERVPVDAIILEGRTHLDESLLTGESLPVAREVGAAVVGGALNAEGRIVVRTSAVGAETQLSRIVRLVESAQARKAPTQQLVDRVSAVFVPAVVAAAVFTALGWGLVQGDWTSATLHAVSVLVIACPCAMGLATPATLMVGTGLAARRGILVRDAQALETLRSVTVVAFDKTGTLTEGRPRLVALLPADAPTLLADAASPPPDPSDSLLQTAAALQAGSEHPLARAVLTAARPEGGGNSGNVSQAQDIQAVPGRGIQGRVDGRLWRLCSTRWLAEVGLAPGALEAASRERAAQGHSLAWLVSEDPGQPPVLKGLLTFADTPKPGARAALQRLQALGIRTVMVSGDHAAAAAHVARELGIAEVRAEVLPADKAAVIASLKAALPAGQHVAMVGDGVNDAPALAAADVGVAMANDGGGTDVAMETAGITLMRGDMALVPEAVALSRAVQAKLRQNLFWAFAYNVVGIPLAALGHLSPMVAGAAMALSSVSVISNALLLARWKPRP